MNVGYWEARWKFVLVYIDDSVFYIRSAAEHIDHLNHVTELLRDAKDTLKLRKIRLFRITIDKRDHVIRRMHLGFASHLTDAIKFAKATRNISGSKLFLGLCRDFGEFWSNFTKNASLFNHNLQNYQPVNLELIEKKPEAMNSLQQRLLPPQVLELPYAEERVV